MAYLVHTNTVGTFLQAKDTITNATPITLISVHVPTAAATLYYCQYVDGQPITYFKPGTTTSQVYTPAPFDLSDISSNIQGKIDNLSLRISNVDRLIGGYIRTYDALRGGEVNVIKVFKGGLADSNSHMRDIYYIDSCVVTAQTAEFTLTSKFEIQKVTLPFRYYRRDQCQWTFKSNECNPAAANATIVAAPSSSHCQKTLASCDLAYYNIDRFGGFPSIPRKRLIR